MLCQDDYLVFTLHGTHTYCRGCINGWASLLLKRNHEMSEKELKAHIAAGG